MTSPPLHRSRPTAVRRDAARLAVGLVALVIGGAPGVARAQGVPATPTDSASARPLSLDAAVTLAERNSPALRIARNAILRATGQQDQARSALFPQLNASASYTRTLRSQYQGIFGNTAATPVDTLKRPPAPAAPCDQYLYGTDTSTIARVQGLENYARCATAPTTGGIDFSRAGFGSRNTYNLGLTGSQNLFTGGRVAGQIAAAAAGRRAARIDYTAQAAQLRLDVTQAYFDAALADRLLVIADSTLAQTEAVLRQTELQQKVGNTSEFELLRARVARDNQRPVVIQRQSQREIAYLRLAQLLDLPLDAPLVLTTPVEDSTAAPPGVNLARAARPDTATDDRAPVREARENVTAQRGQLRVTRSQRLPSLVLSSNYGRIAFPNTGIPSWRDFRSNWTVTLATSFPIFTGGRIRGEERVAEANVRDAQARLTQTRQYAALDARTALAALRQAQASYQASAGTAAEAQQAYQIAALRYREGLSTQVELNDTRNQLADALVNRAQAARDLQIARVRLALLPDLPLTQSGGTTASGTPGALMGGAATIGNTSPGTGTAGARGTTPGVTTPTTPGMTGQPSTSGATGTVGPTGSNE